MKSQILFPLFTAITVMLIGFLIFLPALPIAAYFLKLLWNLVADCMHSTLVITYLTSLKICFYFYILKGLFGISLNIAHKK